MPEVLLVSTVGGSPDAIAAGVLVAKPARVVFVCSPETVQSVTSLDQDKPGIVERLALEHYRLDAGRYETVVVPDSQNLTSAVETIHREVGALVDRWLRRGLGFELVVDFTGGTKCMTMALGLAARVWPCRLQYVGGLERTKEGVGVVVSGKEQIVHFRNPLDVLGYQLIEEAETLFDRGDCAAAASLVERGRNTASQGALKSALTALHHFLDLYARWDRFDHEGALRCARTFQSNAYLLASVYTDAHIAAARQAAADAAAFLAGPASGQASREFVADLAANAHRRILEGRYDDAVARLYRAIEALAQWRLSAFHGMESTSRAPLDRVPEPLRSQWAPSARDGALKLGLQDAWGLLSVLGDPAGEKFEALGLAGEVGAWPPGKGSPLTVRNTSILAHGFRPARREEAERLLDELLQLLDESADSLPRFPSLRAHP
jgi:CRISPR-associated protein (TIGR02710 family)